MSERQLPLFPITKIDIVYRPPKPALHGTDAIAAAVDPFTAYMRQKEFSEHTIKSFLHDLKLLIDFVGPETPLEACSAGTLARFVDYLRHGRKAPCSTRSLDRRITTLKVFFRWLADAEVLPNDPAAPLIHYGAVSPLPKTLDDAQVERVLTITRSMRDAAQSPDARPHLLVTLLLATGIKKSECLGIRLEHIDVGDPAQPVVYIHHEKPRQRFKRRRLGLPGEWAQTLEPYLRRYQPKEYLFECTGRNLEYVLHTIAAVAGLPDNLTFDMLRWTSAVRSFRSGMDHEQLRKRLGLSKISWRSTLPILQALTAKPF